MIKLSKKLSLLLVVVLVLASFAGCVKDKEPADADKPQEEDIIIDEAINKYPLEIIDGFSNKVVLEKAPERIISLAPNNTEILFALGLGEKIVGVTEFCDYPEEALAIDKIGSYSSINYEKVIELEPDLIVNYGELDLDAKKIYEEAGIPVISYMPESIDGVIETIKEISVATDTEEIGNKLSSEMMEKRDGIVSKVKDKEKVRVFYEIWHDPLMAAGPGSFVDELIKLANGENVASDAEGEYANYDLERLVENDPEVYLASNDLPEKTVESILERPGYESISAIKNGKVYLLDGNILSRSGPRIVDALEIIAEAIHQ